MLRRFSPLIYSFTFHNIPTCFDETLSTSFTRSNKKKEVIIFKQIFLLHKMNIIFGKSRVKEKPTHPEGENICITNINGL